MQQLGTFKGRSVDYDETTGFFVVAGVLMSAEAVRLRSSEIIWISPDTPARLGQGDFPSSANPTPGFGEPGKPNSSANGWIAAVGIVVALVVGVVWIGSNISSTPSSSPTSSSASPAESGNGLVVTETAPTTEEYGVRYVTGTVVNQSKREYGYVQVQINLYDTTGNQVGSTMANVNNLAAGGVWKFKAVILEDDATKFKVKEVTGF